MSKLKVGDKLKIRNIEFTICTDKRGKQQYYFLSQGARQLMKDLGITSDNSPSKVDAQGKQICKEDEYLLANRFSKVPAVLVNNNPVRANSLVKLQEFIDYILSVSATIKETEPEKETRKWKKRRVKMMRLESKFGFGHGFGMGPEIFDFFEKAKKANKKMAKRITELEEEVKALKSRPYSSSQPI